MRIESKRKIEPTKERENFLPKDYMEYFMKMQFSGDFNRPRNILEEIKQINK
jgi:hypothetical protein